MIYVAVIVAICLAELLIRRYINQKCGRRWTEMGKMWCPSAKISQLWYGK